MGIREKIEIQEAALQKCERAFNLYLKDFDLNEQFIALKREHTLRVCDEISEISRGLGLSEGEQNFAALIALYHDIGRFEQYRDFATFFDARSVDHAQLGVRIIEREDFFGELAAEVKETALKAILYHNRASLPEDELPEILFYTRLLRDADKIDIFRIMLEYSLDENPAIKFDLPTTGRVCDDVIKSVSERKVVLFRQLKSLDDFRLLQLSWVYDINFKPAFETIVKRKYLEDVRRLLPKSARIDKIFTTIKRDIEKKLKPAAGAFAS